MKTIHHPAVLDLGVITDDVLQPIHQEPDLHLAHQKIRDDLIPDPQFALGPPKYGFYLLWQYYYHGSSSKNPILSVIFSQWPKILVDLFSSLTRIFAVW